MMTKTETSSETHIVSEAPVPAVAPPGQTGVRGGHGFGTAPVFLASVSTILGAVMFLRFGYAVGHAGLPGALAIILLGHLVLGNCWRRCCLQEGREVEKR